MNQDMREVIEWVAQAIEILAVALMVVFIIVGTTRWLSRARAGGIERGFQGYRATLGRSLLVGLELLVAADIIRTVTLEATLSGLAALGALVVVRTMLSWTLSLEVEGRWPWQPERTGEPERDPT